MGDDGPVRRRDHRPGQAADGPPDASSVADRASSDHVGGSDGEGSDAELPADTRETVVETLDRARSALDVAAGLFVATDDAGVVASSCAESGDLADLAPDDAPPIPQSVLRETLDADGTVALRSDGPDRPDGQYLCHCVVADGSLFGVVVFLDRAAEGGERSTSAVTRGVVALAARAVGTAVECGRLQRFAATGRMFDETLLDTVPDVLYAFTTEGQIVQWNDRLEAVTGYETGEIASMGPLEFIVPDDRDAVASSLESIQSAADAIEADLLTADGERIPYQFHGSPIRNDDGDVVGFAGAGRDVSEYRDHERTLTALHDATRDLLRAEGEQGICETVVTTLSEVLDIGVSAAFCFDEDDNVLRPIAQSADADSVVGDPPTFGPGEGLAWRVFMRGDPAVFDDVREAEEVYNPETPVRSELLVPVGEHGVIVAGSTDVGAFDDRTLELASLLAANAEAAFDSVERTRELAARDETLERRNRDLRRLHEVNDRVRRICHALVGVETRGEAERLTCERLPDADHYAFVRIAARDGDGLSARATAGDGQGYVTAVDAEPDVKPPASRAAETGEATVVQRVGDEFRRAAWRREALTRDFRSVAAVPLSHDGVTDGALAVYADREDAFDDETVTVLMELADTVARSIRTAERRRADGALAVTLGVSEGRTLLFALAASLGDLTITQTVAQSGDASLLYGETTAGSETLRSTADRLGLDGVRALSEGDPTRFELRTTGETLAEAVRTAGGDCDRIEFADGRARVEASFPATVDVRSLVDRLERRHGPTELLARRPITDAGADRGHAPLAALTDRQRDALLTAYHAGFFEWPRESSAADIAASLGVSQPTVTELLRRAQGNLLDDVVDE